MRTLGLIGGTSWLSTVDYYRIINEQINQRLGGLNSAKIILYSLNFEELKRLAELSKWGQIAEMLSSIALRLERAGADCLLLCTNTLHMVADDISKDIHIPLIHIAEATSKEVKSKGITKVGLLGTKVTMEQNFFKDKLLQREIHTLIPDETARQFIHNSIFSELGKGILLPKTKTRYVDIINKLIPQGADGIILGCTEIPLLIKQEDCPVPVFDTAIIHAKAAAEFALSDSI